MNGIKTKPPSTAVLESWCERQYCAHDGDCILEPNQASVIKVSYFRLFSYKDNILAILAAFSNMQLLKTPSCIQQHQAQIL